MTTRALLGPPWFSRPVADQWFDMVANGPAHVLDVGKQADLTVLSLDPFTVGESDPGALLDGSVVMTIVSGEIAYDGTRCAAP